MLPLMLSQLRQELRNLLTQQYDKHLRRLNLQSYSNSNRAGKYLANHKKKSSGTKSRIAHLIHSILHHRVTNPQEIADQLADYYSQLYNLKEAPQTPQPKEEAIQKCLHNLRLPHLTETQLQTLNEPFKEPEIRKVVTSLPNGKSPGPDGLSNEYFKTFITTLVPYLQQVFTKAALTASFLLEMLRAYVVTIPKRGKDSNTPANFRLISLLNIDVKVYAKLIAKRLADIIPTLVQYDQMGFVRGQQTSNATKQILNALC